MNAVQSVVGAIYLVAAVTFVLGLHMMRSPRTARNGNLLSASGMALAVAATVVLVATQDYFDVTMWGWIALVAGTLVGAAGGVWGARGIKMTAMPQMVSVFNAVGGGAAAVVAIVEMMRALNIDHATA